MTAHIHDIKVPSSILHWVVRGISCVSVQVDDRRKRNMPGRSVPNIALGMSPADQLVSNSLFALRRGETAYPSMLEPQLDLQKLGDELIEPLSHNARQHGAGGQPQKEGIAAQDAQTMPVCASQAGGLPLTLQLLQRLHKMAAIHMMCMHCRCSMSALLSPAPR